MSKQKNELPEHRFKDMQQFHTSEDQDALLNDFIKFHPFVHCIEVITDNPSPPSPKIDRNYMHVLLDTRMFQDEAVIKDLFSPSTYFISLSPIDTGNCLFVHNSIISFTINEPTYQRFGLQGKKLPQCNSIHQITIQPDQWQLLKRIREAEPIEGILKVSDFGLYQKYMIKKRDFQPSIVTWNQTKDFTFNIQDFHDPSKLEGWQQRFVDAIDQTLLDRNKIVMNSDTQRIVIEGVVNLDEISQWLHSIAQNGYALIMLWDFKDFYSSFIGTKHTMQGFGGGCESLLIGKSLPKAIRVQTINFINQE